MGVQIVPPNMMPVGAMVVLATQTVTCDTITGDSPGSIGFPNDTAFPKQQTGYALGNYQISFVEPVAT